MEGVLLLIPLFLIRYGLLFLFNKKALPKAAFFAPIQENEKLPFYLYQLSTILLILYLCFLTIQTGTAISLVGIVIYLIGVVLFILSVYSFAKPSENGFSQSHLYQFSRNPMYLSYFMYFLGCVFLTQSFLLFLLLCIFQISSHWIILSEERWCEIKFGDQYKQYYKKVNRYL